jgi:hypothetical protein
VPASRGDRALRSAAGRGCRPAPWLRPAADSPPSDVEDSGQGERGLGKTGTRLGGQVADLGLDAQLDGTGAGSCRGVRFLTGDSDCPRSRTSPGPLSFSTLDTLEGAMDTASASHELVRRKRRDWLEAQYRAGLVAGGETHRLSVRDCATTFIAPVQDTCDMYKSACTSASVVHMSPTSAANR